MRTDGSRSVYYAHLDSQMVAEGMLVEIGDTLGAGGQHRKRTDEPTETRLREPSLLGAGPHPGSAVLTTLATGPDVTVLARLDGWVRESESRATGWLEVGD